VTAHGKAPPPLSWSGIPDVARPNSPPGTARRRGDPSQIKHKHVARPIDEEEAIPRPRAFPSMVDSGSYG